MRDGFDQHDAAQSDASPSAAVDDGETVQFCRWMPAPVAPDMILGTDQRPSQKALAYGLIAFMLGGFGLVIFFEVGSVFGLIYLGVVGVLPAALFVGLRVRRWRLDRRMQSAGVPELPSAHSRLRCCGDVGAILADGPIRDVPFEPRIFRAIIKDSRTMRVGGILYAVIMASYLMPTAGTWDIWTTLMLVFYLLFIAALVMRPMYYRVVPGRLDVLRYSLLRLAPKQVDRHDLRSAQVLVDLRRNLVHIVEGEKVSEYSLWFMREREAFARALFEGALSTHDAPAVSDEVL